MDPCTLNRFVDSELHVSEEEKLRQHVKYCSLCAFYVVSGQRLKAAIARTGLRLAPRAADTTKANRARRAKIVYIDSQPALCAGVRQLRPTLRVPLLLCDVEELSCRDIALILDTPVSTVMSRISDAREPLCQLLILQHRKSQ
jgi:DNA-directed RNA polymerase specialized sigma24 family protein